MESFLILLKSAKGAAAVDLIKKVTAARGIYVFSEVLQHANIEALRNHADHSAYYKLLEIFCYGTLADYREQKSVLPSITADQKRKLSILTIVSMASQGGQAIPFADMLQVLELETQRELQDLIIEAIYDGAFKAMLDECNGRLLVQGSVIGRDLRPQDLPSLVSKLSLWMAATSSLIKELECNIESCNKHQQSCKADLEAFTARLDAVKAQNKSQNITSYSAGSLSFMAQNMDIDAQFGVLPDMTGDGDQDDIMPMLKRNRS